MNVSEMIAVAIKKLQQQGVRKPGTYAIQDMIKRLYNVEISYQDIVNRTDVGE